ncbi:protein YgfX [Nitrosomonas sp. sh817]|uniref:protein YgfX n=1 Tax=Nitrosomonas sp. sh817 TaxID=3070658 RepID=UPI0027DCE6D8|nr:protein YgfX [Nitrosomonas sp. sh817]WMJ07360.1 protein YgfX [Nitrosomonas sp. sh817]
MTRLYDKRFDYNQARVLKEFAQLQKNFPDLTMENLIIRRKPSYLLAAILIIAHTATACVLWTLALSWILKSMTIILIIISLIHYVRKDALLMANNAVTELVLTENSQCVATMRSNKKIVCNILNNSFVSPYLSVLILQPEGNFFTDSITILPDGIDDEAFRQLRVWLRWKWKPGE